jgi:serine phosphatase RsbU (regulator of sigma subunit)
VSLCLVTDGVTEARSRDGALYGRARLETLLAAIPPGRGPGEIADAVLDDVRRFGGGAEAADDVAVVVVRWLGPAGADAPVAAVSER